ncbi:MAG: hypothetical protein IPK69_07640 [Phycisphaerales bacterium]|nr:MAG: hypothetical protein IPK69_07640 [Phycisphaerales bacterium]
MDPNQPKSELDVAGQVDRLRARVAELERSALLGTVLAGVAHEINNILTPVLAYAEMAVRSTEDDPVRGKSIERTLAGVGRAATISRAVLSLVRQSGPVSGDLDVAAAVDTAVTAVRAHYPTTLFHVKHSLLTASVPEAQVSTILENLLMNAARESSRVEVVARAAGMNEGQDLWEGIECRTEIPKGDVVFVEVFSPGSRMALEMLAAVARMFRGEAFGAGREARGTGYGLTISKLLADQIGAGLGLVSEPGGVRAILALPVSSVKQEAGAMR